MAEWLSTEHCTRGEYIYSNLGYDGFRRYRFEIISNGFRHFGILSVSQPLGLMDTREVLTSDEQNRLAQDIVTMVQLQPTFLTLEI